MRSKWVYKRKTGVDGSVTWYKARRVPQGISQNFGCDYDETFSPVVRAESIRALLALSTQEDMHLHQMDVQTAFLNGELQEEVYMRQPEGYEVEEKEHQVRKLHKSIYGLKQSPRCWNHVLDKYLKELELHQTSSDQEEIPGSSWKPALPFHQNQTRYSFCCGECCTVLF